MGEFAELSQEVRGIWDRNAAFWDERMGEGNDWHRLLIAPAQERLLALQRDELVLDVACGNGQFARHMARLGARVLASDVAPRMIERARVRTTEHADRIEYRVLDATSREQLLALGERRFDAAVCTMALMDMAAIEPLLAGLGRLLKIGGRFVFSVPHPCFNAVAPRMKKAVEIEERDGELVAEYAIKVSSYIRPAVAKGVAMFGQPALQYYFERPLSLLFGTCFQAGFALDGLIEPVFELPPRPERPGSWENYPEIPPVLVARMRLLPSSP